MNGHSHSNNSTNTNENNNNVENGWFTETEAMWPGQKFSLALDEFSNDSILFCETTAFQNVLVFKSAQFGNVLVLDGVIQLTQRDEFAFHEMMVHLPLCSNRNIANILIVGGGDGAALRQIVTQYDTNTVKTITIVEIDPVVIQVAKEFLDTAPYFEDKRVTIVHMDAATFLADPENSNYDVIIADGSDAVGPAESLFSPEFYEYAHDSLSETGILCAHAECYWIHLELIADLVACCRQVFSTLEYATTSVPTYPCSQIGFLLCRKSSNESCRTKIVRQPLQPHKLEWYSKRMHQAAFVLPPFVERELNLSVNDDDDDDDENDKDQCCFWPLPRILSKNHSRAACAIQ